MGPGGDGAELPARGTVELEFDGAPPAWVEPGEWWALIRVACAGQLVYSPAVKVTVRVKRRSVARSPPRSAASGR